MLILDRGETRTGSFRYYEAKPTVLLTDFPNPCSQKGDKKSEDLYFCYNQTQFEATVVFDKNSLKVGGWKGSKWDNYDWYLSSSGVYSGGNWKYVVANTGGWAKSSYGSDPRAKKWEKRIKMVNTRETLSISLNTTEEPLDSPESLGQYQNPPCHVLALCVWRPHANDPCIKLGLCPNATAFDIKKTKLEGGLILGPKTTSLLRPTIVNGQPSTDEWFQIVTGVSGNINNWLLMAEQAGIMTGKSCVVCMGARPLLQVVPALLPVECILQIMNSTNPREECALWDKVFPVTTEEKNKPIFSSKIAPGNFTCVNLTGTGIRFGKVNPDWCNYTFRVPFNFTPVLRADLWWWCGDNRIFDRLPTNVTGSCALISLLLPASIIPMSANELVSRASSVLPEEWRHWKKRDVSWQNADDPTYIDAIGVPRGVPDEYKLVNQVAAGFESFLCWWCTINKNVDRINYVHYNLQRLGNWTQSGFEAVHGQLAATSLMAFQNRIAIDMILAETGGACAIFRDQCCTFIPNNTASDGSLTKALEGLRTLNGKMKEHSGVDTTMWESWMEVFGKYKTLVSSALISVAVFAAILTLCGCCCIPCLRALVNRLITTAISPAPQDSAYLYPLLAVNNSENEEEVGLERMEPLSGQ